MSDPAGEDDDAVRAFEALRTEVASLRKGIELVYRQGEKVPAVDYSPTLGSMAQRLQVIEQRLTEIERQPALAMTPSVFRERMAAIGESVGQVASGVMREGAQAQRAATEALREVTTQARAAREQRLWNLSFGAVGVMLGVALWYVVPVVLPQSADDWMVASLVGGGPWQAGQTLMRRADPASFEKMVHLYDECGDQPADICARDIALPTAQHAIDEAQVPVVPAKAKQGR
jgi:hypothetical protein